MKSLKRAIPIAFGAAIMATAAQAVMIDFSAFPVGTTDPSSGGVGFWAGDPGLLHDTYVDDALTPTNNYLMSGFADGTGSSPASGYDTFIGVSKAGVAFGTVSFDIASDYFFPATTTLWVQAFLAGAPVGSDSVTVGDNLYHSLSLTLAGGADTLYIFDDLNAFNLGEAFHIDNFNYQQFVSPPPPPPPGVPEPSVLWLVGAGLAGLVCSKRRKSP